MHEGCDERPKRDAERESKCMSEREGSNRKTGKKRKQKERTKQRDVNGVGWDGMDAETAERPSSCSSREGA